jgi:ankyrin repeat protein
MFQSVLYTLDTDVLDILEFSMLHKCVLNLVQLSLAKQLMLSPEEINLPDSAGQTPLFWATTRGDAAAVKALLDYGADPNFANKHGETPLYWATEARSCACMTLLLERGARPNVQSVFGTTPMHYAAWKDNTVNHMQELLRFDAAVNVQNDRAQTPLHYAVDNNSVQTATCLIQAGAHIEAKDQESVTPLLASLRAESPELTRLFLTLGASVHETTSTGNTILHVVAERSLVRTINVLAQSGLLAGMTADVKNHDGKLPRRLLLDRPDCTEELVAAFDRLVKAIEIQKPPATCPEEKSISPNTMGQDLLSGKMSQICIGFEEVFEDALEYHDHYAEAENV